MDTLTILRIVNLAVWGGMLVFMAPGAWAAVTGRGTRRGDPMRLGCWVVALPMALGYGRWLLAPEDNTFWLIVHVMTIVAGIYVIKLALTYGRGGRV